MCFWKSPYQARIDAQDQVLLALLALGIDGVGEDRDTATFITISGGVIRDFHPSHHSVHNSILR